MSRPPESESELQPAEIELWREEVSFREVDERTVGRRQFGKLLVLTSLAMFVGNLWILVRAWFRRAPALPLRRLVRRDEIPVGGALLFRYPGPNDPCILIRLGPDDWVAYSQKCTHLSCAVVYSQRERVLECPCHRGFFSVETGAVLAGPPPRPLSRIRLERRGAHIVAAGFFGPGRL